MPDHWSRDIAPVPESVSRSTRTSSECRLKRLKPARRIARCRSSTVERRSGSTEWIRNGSMIVRNLIRLLSLDLGVRRLERCEDLLVVVWLLGERVRIPLAPRLQHEVAAVHV